MPHNSIYRHKGRGKGGVSENRPYGDEAVHGVTARTPYGGGEREECQRPRPVWAGQCRCLRNHALRGRAEQGVRASRLCTGVCGRGKGGASEIMPYVGGATEELQKQRPMWAEQYIELQEAGHKRV